MAFQLSFYLICFISLFRCVASMYRNYSLERKEICPLNFKVPEITVGKENFSAVIVQDGNYFKNWTGQNAFECKFMLKSTFGLSLMGVIQSMYLRMDETTGECIDYIQFGLPKHTFAYESLLKLDIHKDKWDGRKFCGELNRLEVDSLDDYSVRHKKGQIFVFIRVARAPLLHNTSLHLQMAFTSYRECRNNEGVYQMCDKSTCIHKNYFSDSIINCPGCGDEVSCSPLPNEDGGDPEINTKVTVTAVTSIFLSFFLFLGCMMLCRYFLLFRQWHQVPPPPPGSPTTVEMTMSSPPPPPHPGDSGDLLEEPSSTPSHHPPVVSDKDLPPAYDTLFPER